MILECLLAEIAVTFLKQVKKLNKPLSTQNSHTVGETYEDIYQQLHEDLPRPGLRSNKERRAPETFCKDATVNWEPEKKKVARSGDLSGNNVCLLDAVGYNALLFFLLANLMTGLVNISMRTMHAGPVTA
ncbi:phosphatidylinositol-glycan biosynthesis class W protein, partial [Elysia marginata]